MPFSRVRLNSIHLVSPVITLKQPWASLISMGHKTIETRTHRRFAGLVGQRIYIHAGLADDRSAHAIAAAYIGERELSEVVHGAIIATAFVSAARELTVADEPYALIECATPRFGLFLTDVTPIIIPIQAKGHLGVWYLESAA